MNKKGYLVVASTPEEYELKEIRANKPICFQNGKDKTQAIILQEIDNVVFQDKMNIQRKMNYYAPNNIALLLSVSRKSIKSAENLYLKYFCKDEFFKFSNDSSSKLIKNSAIIYDYIEFIQTSIVFGYTAIEAFCNISIPDNYKYETKNNKGILEYYDKDSIERWITLKEKLSKILIEIYETSNIKTNEVWSNFCEFESYINNIIHQKRIDGTDFYKEYFNKKIFKICEVPEHILKFYFENKKYDKTNSLWPWIINGKNEFPINYNLKDTYFEITDNIFENNV